MSGYTAESGKIGSMELRNRIIMLAMHTGFSPSGVISDREKAYYAERAKSGAGAVTQVAGVNARACLDAMTNIQDDSFVPNTGEIADALHKEGVKHIVQLFHRGRNGQSDFGLKPMAPSNVPSPIYRNECEVMTKADILETISDFASAALKCKMAGVDAVEVSASAGYLLTEFFSPITNLRQDQYGGDEQGRMKAPLDVLRAVRQAVGPDYPVIVRISGSQMIPGGYGVDMMQRFCRIAEQEDLIDAVNVTGGWHEAPVPQIPYQLPAGGYAFLADAIKSAIDLPVIACNRINNLETMESILSGAMADFVGTARGFLADSHFAAKVLAGRPYNRCQACNKCIEYVLKGKPVTCAYNPSVGQELKERQEEALRAEKFEKKKVLVVGAGPAGLTAAVEAARTGHEVTVITKADHIGGMLTEAAVPPEKQGLTAFTENKKAELKALGVNILMETPFSESLLEQEAPDLVIEATGAEAFVPPVKGIDGENVYTALEVLKGDPVILGKLKKGPVVIIGGGSVGIETARYIASKHYANQADKAFGALFIGKDIPAVDLREQITVVEMTGKLGKDLGGIKWIVMKQLKAEGIGTMAEAKVLEITGDGVLVETPEGEQFIPARSVVVAAGFRSVKTEICDLCQARGMAFEKIGDCALVADAMQAIHAGYRLFHS